MTIDNNARDALRGPIMKLRAGQHLRRNRSFTLRQGRLTEGQIAALERLWPNFGIDFDERTPIALDIEQIFDRQAPLTIEIGFGNGESLVQMASEHPERNFIGIAVHTPGVGHCLIGLEQHNLENLRLIQADAVEVLTHGIADNSLDKMQIFFPDPWHKKRHHKRRIIQPDFVELISQKLTHHGRLHIATDWAEYADWIDEILQKSSLNNLAAAGERCMPSPTDRPITKFERRGHRLDHEVFDFLYQKGELHAD